MGGSLKKHDEFINRKLNSERERTISSGGSPGLKNNSSPHSSNSDQENISISSYDRHVFAGDSEIHSPENGLSPGERRELSSGQEITVLNLQKQLAGLPSDLQGGIDVDLSTYVNPLFLLGEYQYISDL